MQEGATTRTKDSSGSRFGMDGTLLETVAWVRASKPMGINQNFSNSSSSGTFVDPGDFMISFPGLSGDEVASPATGNFNFTGTQPFEFGITVTFPTLAPAASTELLSSCQAGQGWQFHYQIDRHAVFYILGVATYDFGYGDSTDNGIIVQDLNSHRVFLARNAAHLYLFVDGKPVGDKTLVPGTIVAGSNPLRVGGGAGGQGLYAGKASRLAIYNFPWTTFSEIAAFAKNDYLYWQGMDDGSGVGE